MLIAISWLAIFQQAPPNALSTLLLAPQTALLLTIMHVYKLFCLRSYLLIHLPIHHLPLTSFLSAEYRHVQLRETKDAAITSYGISRDAASTAARRVVAFSLRVAYKSRQATNCFVKRCDIAPVLRRWRRRLLLMVVARVLMRMPVWWIGGSSAQKMPQDVFATLTNKNNEPSKCYGTAYRD